LKNFSDVGYDLSLKPGDRLKIYLLAQLAPAKFLSLPDFWIGLALLALLLTASGVQRRFRGPI
jgi:hypothetical protein